jgi:hypothetical protein
MTMIRRFVLRLLSFFRHDAAEAELSREIRAHLQLLEDEHVAKGMSRDDARLAARRAFGGVEQAKERQRDARGFRWLEDSRLDLKLGVRMLVKYPGLSIVGGAGLAVGVAIGAAFFAFLYSLIYATVPVEGGDRIVALENWDIDAGRETRRSMHDLVTWRREMKTVGEIGAFRTIARNVTVAGSPVEAVEVAQITADGFNITRVAPVIGRAIVAADERAGASPIVVIGYDVWHSRFGGDASVLGRELRLGNVVHTIVGVMPQGYGFPVTGYHSVRSKLLRLNRERDPTSSSSAACATASEWSKPRLSSRPSARRRRAHFRSRMPGCDRASCPTRTRSSTSTGSPPATSRRCSR